MDTTKLIILIQERECLWNQKNPGYHSRDIQRRIWDEVAEETNNNVPDIKKKWRSLRDIFRREYKKTITSKSGDSGGEYIPKWPFYNIMIFLKDTMTTRELKGKAAFEGDEDDADEPDSDPLNDSAPDYYGEIVPQTQQPSTSRRVFKSPLKKKPKWSKEVSDLDAKPFENDEENQNVTGNTEDSEMRFLMSLHPFLKQIPPSRQLAVRANIMQAFMSNEATSQHSSNSRQSSGDEW